MVDLVLRIFKHDFSVQAWLDNYPLSYEHEVYAQGEADVLGGSNDCSGVDILVAEQCRLDDLDQAILQFLDEQEPMLVAAMAENCTGVLDVALTLSEQHGSSILLAPITLAQLAKYDLAVEFSVYASLH